MNYHLLWRTWRSTCTRGIAVPISVAAINWKQDKSVYQEHLIINSFCLCFVLNLLFLANLADIQRPSEEL